MACYALLQGIFLEIFSDPGIEPTSLMSPALAGGFFTASTTWEAHSCSQLESVSSSCLAGEGWCLEASQKPRGSWGPVPSPAVGWERKVGGGVLTGVRFEEWGGED